jgi:hypothetical protein
MSRKRPTGGNVRNLIVVSAFAIALALPGLAVGGGWATVGFEPLPDGTAAGATWHPTIFIRQHGVTPLDGLEPVVTIRSGASGQTRSFPATGASEAGTYEADVVFPKAGDWRIVIDSGFGESRVTYGPVTIVPPGSGPDLSRLPGSGTLVGLGVLAFVAAALLGGRRLRRLVPASR